MTTATEIAACRHENSYPVHNGRGGDVNHIHVEFDDHEVRQAFLCRDCGTESCDFADCPGYGPDLPADGPFIELYPNIDVFYSDRGGRLSPECDYGVHHFSDIAGVGDGRGVESRQRWKVSVVLHTGDVYAQLEPEREVALLGQVAANDNYADAERRFQGWTGSTDDPGRPGGQRAGRPLSWFLMRLDHRKHTSG